MRRDKISRTAFRQVNERPDRPSKALTSWPSVRRDRTRATLVPSICKTASCVVGRYSCCGKLPGGAAAVLGTTFGSQAAIRQNRETLKSSEELRLSSFGVSLIGLAMNEQSSGSARRTNRCSRIFTGHNT